jgi:aminoglycoside/choline kinase family phosphotransferase
VISLENKIKDFLNKRYSKEMRIEKASDDASFRKYYRIFDNNKSLILMVAPPELEPTSQFLFLANELKQRSVNVPNIIHSDQSLGLIIQEDFGNLSLMQYLANNTEVEKNKIFNNLIKLIIFFQCSCSDISLEKYSKTKLLAELNLFNEWYLRDISFDKEHLDKIYSNLVENALKQEQKFVHRDFHCRNLIIHNKKFGVIDFQDALIGPVTYDLISILKDAYYKLSPKEVVDFCKSYWDLGRKKLNLPSDFSEFLINFELMGVQRHLKILGIFVRLAQRDGKSQYLNDIPLVENYILDLVKSYPQLNLLEDLIIRRREQN